MFAGHCPEAISSPDRIVNGRIDDFTASRYGPANTPSVVTPSKNRAARSLVKVGVHIISQRLALAKGQHHLLAPLKS